MGNLGDPMKMLQEMLETSTRHREEIEELEEMEEEQEQELDFFEQKRLDLIGLSQTIESLEADVTRYDLDDRSLELSNEMVSNFMNYLTINKEKVEIKFQEKKKEREKVKLNFIFINFLNKLFYN